MKQRELKTLTWADHLTFGGAALAVSGLFVLALLTPQPEERSLWGFGLVAVLFWLPYFVLWYYRSRVIRKVAWRTRHGVHVILGEFDVDRIAVSLEVDRTLKAWQVAVSNAQELAKIEDILNGLLLVFRTLPFVSRHGKQQLAGWASPAAHVIHVGYVPDLRKSTLGHELGHIFLAALGKDPSETLLYHYHKTFGIPY